MGRVFLITTMFLVSNPTEKRITKIRSFLGSDENGPIAILWAAVQFEWIVSRAILVLGRSPGADLREKVNRTSGLDAYKVLWRDEISIPGSVKRLPDIVKNWQRFKDSFNARHRIVHGTMSANKSYALKVTPILIAAAEDVRKFTEALGFDLHAKLKTRRRPRNP